MVATILEERQQRRLNDFPQRDIESLVQQRTQQLSGQISEWQAAGSKVSAKTGFVSPGIDISDRKSAEVALRESEFFLNTLLNAIPIPVFYKDRDGRYLGFNNAFETFFGATRERLIGKTVFDINPQELAEIYRAKDAELFESGEVQQYESQVKNTHGLLRNVIFNKAVFTDSQGAIIGLIGAILDITESKKLEHQLLQSQKMESIGTLAGGVAHDFNNMLAAIIGYGSIVLNKMPRNDPQRQNLEHMLEAADRAAHLTKDLLLFSRKQPIDRKPVKLNEHIQKVSMFLSRIVGEDIAFKTTLSGGDMRIFADSHQIDQVLMNLATNARDAMPQGGIFTITTEQVWLDETSAATHGLGMSGRYVLVTVSDTGQGMNEETTQRIFEPFFTTKEVGKGTGLGLAVVYGIVKQHEGSIKVYSEPGQGTTFRIYFPVIAAGVSEEKENAAEEPPVGGSETILLAEDDRSVLDITGQILRDFGYTVITAVDGADAVKKFTDNKDSIQLLLLDLIMPNKTGKDAYDEIRKMRPDIRVIFASGYDPDLIRQKALLERNVPVVYKPASIQTLLKTIRSVLDNGKA
jgi:PAS domain S-box-containing protein